MKLWLHLCLLFCYFSTWLATPTSLLAAPLYQHDMATLQLENQSSQSLAICEIFAIRKPAEVVLDLQEQIDLPPGGHKEFTVPPGHYRLLISDCNQQILVQEQDLAIAEHDTRQLPIRVSPATQATESPAATASKVVLQIRNNTEQTICEAYITSVTANEWGNNQLGDATIAAGETYSFPLAPGNYDLLLADCDGNMLLDRRSLTIEQDHKLSLTQADLHDPGCESQANQGIQAYQSNSYEEARTALQLALVCYRETGDRASEGGILLLIGAAYDSQGYYAEALENYEQALTILRSVGDRASEGIALNNIGLLYDARGDLDKALEYYEQALTIRREVGDRKGEGVTLNNIALIYDARGDLDKALEYYEQALTIRREVGDRIGEGVTLNNMGLLYHAQGRYDKALETYKQALAIRHEVGDRPGEGTTLHNIAGVYRAQGRYREALATYQQALAIGREIGDLASEGTTHYNIAGVYRVQGRYSEALATYQQALAIRHEIGDRAGESNALNGIGLVYQVQGRYSEALASYEQSLAIGRAIGDRAGEGAIRNNVGEVYYAQGRYSEALAQFQQALAIRRSIGDRTGEGTILGNIGIVYLEQGRYEEALTTHQQALAISRAVGDRAGEGTALNSIGGVYGAQGRYDEAVENYEQALTIIHSIGNRDREGTILNNIAGIYHDQGRYDEALITYQQALTILETVGNPAVVGTTLNNMGLLYADQGQYEEALKQYQRALVTQRAVGDRASEGVTLSNLGRVYAVQEQYDEAMDNFQQALLLFREAGDRANEGTALDNIGALYQVQRRYDKALDSYEQAMDTIESVRAVAGSEIGRARFIDQYISLYNRTLQLYIAQDEPLAAFVTSERGRARTFLDSLATGVVQLADDDAATLLTNEQAAYAEQLGLQDALARARAVSPAEVAELEVQLMAAQEAHAAALAAITARGDRLTQLVPGRSQVLDPSDVQSLLDSKTTLVSYWMLPDRTVAFIINASDPLAIVEFPEATPQNITQALNVFYRWTNREQPYPRALRNLYDWLITPIKEQINTPHIAIVPHQLLHYVPFAALNNGEYYLDELHTLSILPSASVLPYLLENAQFVQEQPDQSSLIYGNPATDDSNQAPLFYAASEAEAVAALIEAPVYTGSTATEERLRTITDSLSFVHLAAHGSYNTVNPFYSALFLTPSGEYDGRLETHEIFGLPLRGVKAVVLSACETNVGELSTGDEVVGLTRAFFFAGAPTVISSLWSVDDAATEALMVSFYTYWLQDGLSKAQALQAAQADVRADPRWASPFYWAGFVLNGDPGQRNHASSVK